MDRIEPESDTEEPDGAEAAFDALRREVAALRQGAELVYRQSEDAKRSATHTDYSPTLGAISKELAEVQGRLQAIEAKPGLALSPTVLSTQIKQAREEPRLDLNRTQGQLKAAMQEIEALAGQVRTRTAQRTEVIITGILGVLVGLCLWIVLIRAVLPAGAATWMAALPIGGGPWHAGQELMEEASPASWDRMVRLYRACPAESPVERCEAAMTVPAAASTAEPAKTPNPGPVPAGSHTRAGR